MEVREGGAGAATIIEFWTMEGYAVGFLIFVAVVTARSMLVGDKEEGSVLTGGYFSVLVMETLRV